MAAESPFLRNDDVPVEGPPRELVGYGEHPPKLDFPGGARVAVQLVVNYEEGSEKTFAMGDGENDILYELPFALEGQRGGLPGVAGARLCDIERGEERRTGAARERTTGAARLDCRERARWGVAEGG